MILEEIVKDLPDSKYMKTMDKIKHTKDETREEKRQRVLQFTRRTREIYNKIKREPKNNDFLESWCPFSKTPESLPPEYCKYTCRFRSECPVAKEMKKEGIFELIKPSYFDSSIAKDTDTVDSITTKIDAYMNGYDNAIKFAYLPDMSKELMQLWAIGFKDGKLGKKKTTEEIKSL